MTIIRIATDSREMAQRLDRALRARGFQSAPSGIHVSTDAARPVVDQLLDHVQTPEKRT